MFRLDSQGVYRAQPLEELPWLGHGFGTRSTEDWPPSGLDLATLKQIHSDTVLFAESPGCQGSGDALLAQRAHLGLVIRTADCLPILIVDKRTRAIAAVHAGWRGVVQDIVSKSLESMRERFGTRSEDVILAIGPGIGECCFEVGPEVAREFALYFPERQDLNERTHVDLVETVSRQMRRNGGSVGQIAISGMCSKCQSDRFHSYRRDREAAGRMLSAIWIR